MTDLNRKIEDKYSNKKQIGILVILLFTYIVFHKPIESFLQITIVNHLLSQIDTSWYNDLIFIILIIASIIICIKRFKKYVPSKSIIAALISCSIIYLVYRFNEKPWCFTPFYFSKSLKYGDTLVIISIVNLFSLVKGSRKIPEQCKESFFEDNPLGENIADELGYEKYAKIVANRISKSNYDHSFAIGINGKWGLGKTSFIDLLKRQINDPATIEINFYPWNSNTPQAIIKDFFETLQEKIAPYHSSVSRILTLYSNKLIRLQNNSLTQSIHTSIAFLTGYESLDTLFKDINTSLKQINKKIIIYIDDIDRLDKEEIIEVVRLIRNTANFYNTFFIVAYDRNYIVNALKDHNSYNHGQFLEKIFQLEITLPYFNKNILRIKLLEKLKFSLPSTYGKTIEEIILGTPAVAPIFLNDWLDSIRDVTRLANAITLNSTNLLGETDLADFIKIELLHLKYPSVYELLFRKSELFFKAENTDGRRFKYQLKTVDDNFATQNANNKNEKYLAVYLDQNSDSLLINKQDIHKIMDFIQSIFSDSKSFGNYSKSNLSITYPSKFHRYFSYNLLEGNLSEIAFSKARSLDQVEFNAQILEWYKKGLEFELKSRFGEIKSFDNKQDFEKVITAIFYLATLQNEKSNYSLVVGYDGKDLFEKLSNYNNELSDKYYSNNGKKEGLKKFIYTLFKKASPPFSFESDFIRYVNSVYLEDIEGSFFPLSKEELKDISIGYLNDYCESTKNLDRNLFLLLWNTEQTNFIPQGVGTYLNEKIVPIEAKEIVKKFFLKNFDEFLLWIIDIEPIHQKSFTIAKSIIDIYGSWEAFKIILFDQDENEWKYLDEFKTFFLEVEKKNFAYYVSFDFKIIPISTRIRNE